MASRDQRLTKRQQRLSEKGQRKDNVVKMPSLQHLHLELKQIDPLTDNQQLVFDRYSTGDTLFLHGCPGTGKTFLALYLAFKEIYSRKSVHSKVVIIRSAQPSKQIGFLPGSAAEKTSVYEAPYKNHCSKLFGRADAYDILKQKGMLEFQSTSFLRGTEIEDAIVIIDECQNLSYGELKTSVSRLFETSRLVICGDTKQDDLTSARFNEESGLPTLMKVLDRMPNVSTVNFQVNDIVRSGFVKEFIMAEYELGLI